MRDDPSSEALPELHAEVRTTKLMMEGTMLMPARRAAITKGDSDAVPLLSSRFGSFEGTSIPTKKMLRTGGALSALGLLSHPIMFFI